MANRSEGNKMNPQTEKIVIIIMGVVGFIAYAGLQAYQATEDYKVMKEVESGNFAE